MKRFEERIQTRAGGSSNAQHSCKCNFCICTDYNKSYSKAAMQSDVELQLAIGHVYFLVAHILRGP